jgi:hypothetical protein
VTLLKRLSAQQPAAPAATNGTAVPTRIDSGRSQATKATPSPTANDQLDALIADFAPASVSARPSVKAAPTVTTTPVRGSEADLDDLLNGDLLVVKSIVFDAQYRVDVRVGTIRC